MTRKVIALKYARGLFAVGKEDGQFKEYGQELDRLAAFLREAPDIMEALENPVFPPDLKLQIVEELIKALNIIDAVAKFLRLLVEKRRIHHIAQIAEAYQELLDEELGISRAKVVAAIELSPEDQQKLAEALEKVTGQKVIVEMEVDPSIIGGVVARIGDLVLDGSIRAQLEKFKESIRRGEVAS